MGYLRPVRQFHVRLSKLRREQAFVLVDAPDEEAAKQLALDRAERTCFTLTDVEIDAVIAPLDSDS